MDLAGRIALVTGAQAALRSDAFRAVGRDEAQLLQATGGSAEMLFGSDI